MNFKLSIIVVNYKGRDHLKTCLGAAYENPPNCAFEIVVVDNASNDGSVELLEESFPEVKIIRNKYNYGFAVANNQGFNASSGDYLMTLNPDAEVIGDALDLLVAQLDSRQDLGIVSPCVVEETGVVSIHFEFPVISSFRSMRRLGIGKSDFVSDPPNEIKEVSWLSGTGYVCRRSALGDTFFDETTFLFAEEYEICDRVRRAGYKIAVCPTALIRHIGSVTFRHNKEKSAVARRLMEAACWQMRKRLFGSTSANIHQFFRGVDDAIMWSALFLKGLFAGRSEGRDLEMSNFRTVFITSLNLIMKGDAYFERVNRDARKYFNDGVDVPLPPETLLIEKGSPEL